MPVVVIYSSTQACPPVLTLALDMQAKGHVLRTLRHLPPPRPMRLASLQLELAHLHQIERTIRWTLSQYAEGYRLPDAQRESDLRADLEVTLWQIDQALDKLCLGLVAQSNG